MSGWYFQVMGETIGPISTAELRERAMNGQISDDTLIRKDGVANWVSADRVAGLFDQSQPTAVVSSNAVQQQMKCAA